MEKQIPIYEAVIEAGEDWIDGKGIEKVSVVKSPANMMRYVAFNEGLFSVKFAADNDRRILTGVLLVPNQKIYRNDDHGEYYLMFNAESIERLRDTFMKQLNIHNVNAEHSKDVQGVYLIETWISDVTRGVKPPDKFADIPDGTWFVSYRVENDEVWNKAVYDGTFNGFSIEGLLSVRRLNFSEDMRLQRPIQTIEQSIDEMMQVIEIIKHES